MPGGGGRRRTDGVRPAEGVRLRSRDHQEIAGIRAGRIDPRQKIRDVERDLWRVRRDLHVGPRRRDHAQVRRAGGEREQLRAVVSLLVERVDLEEVLSLRHVGHRKAVVWRADPRHPRIAGRTRHPQGGDVHPQAERAAQRGRGAAVGLIDRDQPAADRPPWRWTAEIAGTQPRHLRGRDSGRDRGEDGLAVPVEGGGIAVDGERDSGRHRQRKCRVEGGLRRERIDGSVRLRHGDLRTLRQSTSRQVE